MKRFLIWLSNWKIINMLLYVMLSSIMMGNAIKVTEQLKPFMPTDKKEPETLKHGNWTRRTIPEPAKSNHDL